MYALSNITCCKLRQETRIQVLRGRRWIRSLIIIIGFIASILVAAEYAPEDGRAVWMGTMFISSLIAAAFIKTKRPYMLYTIQLGSASGDQDVLASTDWDVIKSIHQSINDAIISRG